MLKYRHWLRRLQLDRRPRQHRLCRVFPQHRHEQQSKLWHHGHSQQHQRQFGRSHWCCRSQRQHREWFRHRRHKPIARRPGATGLYRSSGRNQRHDLWHLCDECQHRHRYLRQAITGSRQHRLCWLLHQHRHQHQRQLRRVWHHATSTGASSGVYGDSRLRQLLWCLWPQHQRHGVLHGGYNRR